MAAIHHKGAAGHIVGKSGSQQQQRTTQVISLPQSTLRNTADHFLAGFTGKEIAVQIGLDVTRRKCINADSISGPFPVSYTHLTLPTIYSV